MIILGQNERLNGRDRKKLWELTERKRARYISRYEKRIAAELNRQAKAAVRALRQAQSVDTGAEAAVLAISLQGMSTLIQELTEKVAPAFYSETLKGAKRHRGGFETKDAAEAIFFRNLAAYVLANSAKKVTSITETTRNELRIILASAVKDGMSIPNTAAMINRLTSIRNRRRARTIARTEVVGAGNFGSIEAAAGTGLQLEKIWIATQDDRTRDSHREADGQTVGLRDKFSVQGESLDYPHDPTAAASNVINCRCAQAYKRI